MKFIDGGVLEFDLVLQLAHLTVQELLLVLQGGDDLVQSLIDILGMLEFRGQLGFGCFEFPATTTVRYNLF